MRSDDVGDRVRALVAPCLEAAGLELFDVELAGQVLRVSIDRPGGIDLDAISQASRLVSVELDRQEDVVPGRYVLEVSSPGVERPLRTPEHFKRMTGSTVVVKTSAGTEGDRRVEGVLEAADDNGVVVAGRAIPYAAIERARTRFVWPEPGAKSKTKTKTRAQKGPKKGPKAKAATTAAAASGPEREDVTREESMR